MGTFASMEEGQWKQRSWDVAGEVSGRPFGLKKAPQSEPGFETAKINMKTKHIIFAYIPGTGVWESLASKGARLVKWWMSYLHNTLQSLHCVLAEESQENKWLSFKFQEQNRGDRQCECHSPHSIDFSAVDAKQRSPEGRESSQIHRPKEVCL